MAHSEKMHESKTPVQWLKRCLKMGQTIFKFEWQLLELQKLNTFVLDILMNSKICILEFICDFYISTLNKSINDKDIYVNDLNECN